MSTPTSGSYALLPNNMEGEIDDDDDSISKLSHSSMGDHDADRYTGAEDADIESEGASDDEELPTRNSKNKTSDEKKPMSTTRRVCFLGSLVLCIIVIFVFAFFFPCNTPSCFASEECNKDAEKVRKSEYHSVKFPDVLSFSPVRLWDVNQDRTTDIIIGTKSGVTMDKSTQCNSTFSDQKCPGIVFAVSGKDGSKLWQFNSLDEISFIACDSRNGQPQTECVLRGSKSLHYIDVQEKKLVWSVNVKGTIQSVLIIPDLNGDMSNDIIFAYNNANERGWLEIISGKSGHPIGSPVSFPEHYTATGIMLLHNFQETNHIMVSSQQGKKHLLWAIILKDLFLNAAEPSQHSDIELWGSLRPNTSSGFYELLTSDVPISIVQSDLNLDGIDDFLLCANDALLAWNGIDLKQLWYQSLDYDHELSSLAVGRFTPDIIPDVFVSLKLHNDSEVFMIIDGSNGSMVWMIIGERSTIVNPVTITTSEHWNDGFMFWMETTKKDVGTELNSSKRDAIKSEKLQQSATERASKTGSPDRVFERRQRRYPEMPVKNQPMASSKSWSPKRNTKQGEFRKGIKMNSEAATLENQDFVTAMIDSLPDTHYSGAISQEKFEKEVYPDEIHDIYPSFDGLSTEDYLTSENVKRNFAGKFLQSLGNQDIHSKHIEDSEYMVHIRRRRDIGFREHLPISGRDYIFEKRLLHNYPKQSRRIRNFQNWPLSRKLDLTSMFGSKRTIAAERTKSSSGAANWYRDFTQRQKPEWMKEEIVQDNAGHKNDERQFEIWKSYESPKVYRKMVPDRTKEKDPEDVKKVRRRTKLDMRKTRGAENEPIPTEKSDVQTGDTSGKPDQSCSQSTTRLQGFMVYSGANGKPTLKLIAQELARISVSQSACSLFTPKIQSTPAVGNDNGKIQFVYAINYYMESIAKHSENSYMLIKRLSLPFKPRKNHSVKRRSTTEHQAKTVPSHQDISLPLEM